MNNDPKLAEYSCHVSYSKKPDKINILLYLSISRMEMCQSENFPHYTLHITHPINYSKCSPSKTVERESGGTSLMD